MPSSDSFGTYLATQHLLRKGDETAKQAEQPAPDSQALTESATISIGLVTDHSFPMQVHELLKKSGLPLNEFSDALAAIQSAGLVEVAPGDDGEMVDLTAKGRQFQEAVKGS